ncbi:MAG TPA: hypothetical protein VKV20_00430 [Ktedonobacteraceae bacterium]|nr:hypothetical protein [Ktedonobacteraceae bacterium]
MRQGCLCGEADAIAEEQAWLILVRAQVKGATGDILSAIGGLEDFEGMERIAYRVAQLIDEGFAAFNDEGGLSKEWVRGTFIVR